MTRRFLLAGSMVMLNLIVAVVLDNFADQRNEEARDRCVIDRCMTLVPGIV